MNSNCKNIISPPVTLGRKCAFWSFQYHWICIYTLLGRRSDIVVVISKMNGVTILLLLSAKFSMLLYVVLFVDLTIICFIVSKPMLSIVSCRERGDSKLVRGRDGGTVINGWPPPSFFLIATCHCYLILCYFCLMYTNQTHLQMCSLLFYVEEEGDGTGTLGWRDDTSLQNFIATRHYYFGLHCFCFVFTC